MTERRGKLLTQYDFVDFGCSSGGSMTFARDNLGGQKGLGLDIDERKVIATREAGFEAEVIDVTTLDPAEVGTTQFAIMAHFLEHLTNLPLALRCIDAAVRVADEFVLIRQPYFDADAALARDGLKLYWSHWSGHKNHMTTSDLRAPLDRMLADGRIGGFVIFVRTPIRKSDNVAIHPLSSPINQHGWDASRHDPKPDIVFDFPVYREVGALIRTRADQVRNGPLKFLETCEVLDGGGVMAV